MGFGKRRGERRTGRIVKRLEPFLDGPVTPDHDEERWCVEMYRMKSRIHTEAWDAAGKTLKIRPGRL